MDNKNLNKKVKSENVESFIFGAIWRLLFITLNINRVMLLLLFFSTNIITSIYYSYRIGAIVLAIG